MSEKVSEAPTQVITPMVPSVSLAGSIRRTVLDWRDYWLVETELTLNRDAKLLIADLESVFATRPFAEVIMRMGEQSRARIDQTLRLWMGELQERLIDRAQAELRFSLRSEHFSQQDLESLLSNPLVLNETPLMEMIRKASEANDPVRIKELVTSVKSDSIFLEISTYFRGLTANVLMRP